MIIDFHTHIFSPEVIRNRERYLAADAGFAALYNQPSARLSSAEELIESMDNSGVDMSIVCGFAWSNAALCRKENDYILETVSRYSQRLLGMVTISLDSKQSALYELERCVSNGIIGLGEMRPSLDSIDNAIDSLWTPIVDFLTKNNLLCMFHASEPVGHSYPGKENLTPAHLYQFISHFPELKIVLAHWGGGLPFYNLMPEVKKTLANTWYDSAASPFLYDASIYKHMSELINTKHILFGSDYPLMPHMRALKELNDIVMSNNLKQLILSGNATKLIEELHDK